MASSALRLLLAFALLLTAIPLSAQVDLTSFKFRVSGQLVLDATGNPLFGIHDQPQWPTDASDVVIRSTGVHADTCTDPPGPIVVSEYSDPSWPRPTVPVDVVDPSYSIELPSYGGTYTVRPRMQLGDERERCVNCPGAGIAEDWYLFDPWETPCVPLCTDQLTPPPGFPPPGECFPELPTCTSCGGCTPCTSCANDCSLCTPTDCQVPQGDDVFLDVDHTFTEDVAFLEITIKVGNQTDCEGDCCAQPEVFHEMNPIEADIRVECLDAQGSWQTKAGTYFSLDNANPFTRSNFWKNEDSCTPQDVLAADALDPGCTAAELPRVPIYFPIPANRTCRVYGDVRLGSCEASGIPADIIDLLFPNSPDVTPCPNGQNSCLLLNTMAGLGGNPVRGQLVHVDGVVATNDLDLIKACEISACGYAAGHLVHTDVVCCGPEYGDLHTTLNLHDSSCTQRPIYIDFIGTTLDALSPKTLRRAYADAGEISPRNSTSCTGGLFGCIPALPYISPVDPPLFPSCGTPVCCPSPLDACAGPCAQLAYGGTDGLWVPGNAPGGNPATDGNWWRISGVELRLQHRKNYLRMTGVEGLHGLLMADDISLCDDELTAENWDHPSVYPNIDDIADDLAAIRSGGVCSSPGMLVTNVQRRAVDPGVPSEVEDFTICSPDVDPLLDTFDDPHFIRTHSLSGGPAADCQGIYEIYPTWIPDSTLCSELANIRGIVRVIDGTVTTAGEVRSIGLTNPFTLNRFLHFDAYGNPPFKPADWATRSVCTEVASRLGFPAGEAGARGFTTESLTYVHTGDIGADLRSTGAPISQTVLQTFYAEDGQCPGEEISSCACDIANPEWPVFFGMPRLINLETDAAEAAAIEAEIVSRLGLTSLVGSIAGAETVYHYDQLVGLTNNVRATGTTRQVSFHFANDKFESGISERPSPVRGSVTVYDVTKPNAGREVSLSQPPSFANPATNPNWPYSVRCYDQGRTSVDGHVPPRVGLGDQPGVGPPIARPWCDTTNDTDPHTPDDPNIPACLETDCSERAGRTLVDRYTITPNDCKVENLAVCFGELRFKFAAIDPGTETLIVQGAGYLNSVAHPGQLVSTRPDLRVAIDGVEYQDLNEDSIPDQYVASAEFRRFQAWDSAPVVGNPGEVVAFLPAGEWRFIGRSEDGSNVTLPVVVPVTCGGVTLTEPECEFQTECSQDGTATITGTLFGAVGHDFNPSSPGAITWTTAAGSGDVTFTSDPSPAQSILGTFDADDVALDPGCNDVTVTAVFTQGGAAVPIECTAKATLDDVRPICTPPSAPAPIVLAPGACTAPVTVTASVTDLCDALGGCAGVPATAGQLSSYDATLTGGATPLPVDCALDDADCEVTATLGCGEYAVTWDAVDLAGNASAPGCSTTLTVEDQEPPVFVSAPADLQLSCLSELPPPETAETDNLCGLDDIVVHQTSYTGNSCQGQLTRIYIATDVCGVRATHVQRIFVHDLTAPVFDGAPPQDTEIGCLDDLPTPAVLTATDDCNPVTVDYEQHETLNGGCGVIERTWTATDSCGNTTFHTQVITVNDDTSPTFDLPLPADEELSCFADFPAPEIVTATDDCTMDRIDFVESPLAGTECDGVITRTWSALDTCGNATTHTQTLTIRDDIAPVFGPLPVDFEIDCSTDLPPAPIVTATDNCSKVEVILVQGPLVGSECQGTITRTWSATDACGNTVEHVQTITVRDDVDPEFGPLPDDFEIDCSTDLPAPPDVTATDNCTQVEVVLVQDPLVGSECQGTITRTWIATDECGNAVEHVQTITVRDDVDPEFGPLPDDFEIDCSTDLPSPPDVTATDNCTQVEVVLVQGPLVGSECQGTITRTWTATDECGNAVEHVQTITVRDDVDPVFGPLPDDFEIDCSTDLPAPPIVTATDNCTGAVVELDESPLSGTECDGRITRTWTATDGCGNAVVHVQTITVRDDIDPVPIAILMPLAPEDPSSASSPGSPGSACSPRSSQSFQILCSGTDNCDPNPLVTAVLIVANSEISTTGECISVVEEIEVECDDVVTLQLAAPPCPAVSPQSARPAVTVSSGVTVITGESIVLEVTATDACGNNAAATADASQLCEEGQVPCCPVIAPPEPGRCEPGVCEPAGGLFSHQPTRASTSTGQRRAPLGRPSAAVAPDRGKAGSLE